MIKDDDYYMVTMPGIETIYLATSAEAVAKAEEIATKNPGKLVRMWCVELYNEWRTEIPKEKV